LSESSKDQSVRERLLAAVAAHVTVLVLLSLAGFLVTPTSALAQIAFVQGNYAVPQSPQATATTPSRMPRGECVAGLTAGAVKG
jgi:hypothetical protein